ncbi:recombinase family protein [Mycoplana azooxidifex]|uniref:recombinase family protein n=1 Tax=Mycoplana azooxidifex TaxID=1636188 RepID=UPI001616EFEE
MAQRLVHLRSAGIGNITVRQLPGPRAAGFVHRPGKPDSLFRFCHHRSEWSYHAQKRPFYARYSTERQNEVSIETQIELGRDFIESRGWKLIDVFTDHAVSGTSSRYSGPAGTS